MDFWYFVRSGYVNINDGKRYRSGLNGYVWSSAAHSNGIYGYYLVFNASVVNPSDGSNRWVGFPLRCLGS